MDLEFLLLIMIVADFVNHIIVTNDLKFLKNEMEKLNNEKTR